MSPASTFVIALIRAALASPATVEVLGRLLTNVSRVRDVDPVGFLHSLFDPAKAEANAVALVSAGLDAQQVEVDISILRLSATTAEAVKVGESIAEAPPYDR